MLRPELVTWLVVYLSTYFTLGLWMLIWERRPCTRCTDLCCPLRSRNFQNAVGGGDKTATQCSRDTPWTCCIILCKSSSLA